MTRTHQPGTGPVHESTPPDERGTQVQLPLPSLRRASAGSRHARIVIQYPAPAVDDGRYPAKRCVGRHRAVEADIFRDGHELLRAVVRYTGPGATS